MEVVGLGNQECHFTIDHVICLLRCGNEVSIEVFMI
jgi:hypothetical protein